MAMATATRTPRKRPKRHEPRDGARAHPTRQEARRKAIPRDTTQRAADLLALIGDPTRLGITLTLSGGERRVSDLCKSMGGLSQPAVSHHLALGRHAGIWSYRRQGKENFYALTPLGLTLARLAAPLVEST